MNSISIALCDDDRFAADAAAGTVRSFFVEQGISVRIEVFCQPERLLSYCQRTAVDLVLLDIEMPGMDGIRLGRLLKEQEFAPEIIFVSNREDQVFSALHIHPFGFVRKNHFLKDARDVLTSYLSYSAQKQEGQQFLVTTSEGRRSVDAAKVEYFEGDGTYQKMYLAGEKEPVRITSRMKTLEENLAPLGFLRIHKGYLVNFRAIRTIQTTGVVLKSGKSLPVSRGNAQAMQARYLALCRENGMMLF